MICRIRGQLEALDACVATIAASDDSIARQVMVPAYLAADLAPKIGQTITLTTLEYLEAQGQGTSFIPRLVGFRTPGERRFFEVFTTVKGLGNKRALRALEAEPASVVEAIIRKDTKALQALPEIGKRLSETIVAELSGKVEGLLADLGWSPERVRESKPIASPTTKPAEEAILALVALGQTRAEAERKIAAAADRVGPDADTDALVSAAFGG